jgi:hypothetical protein
MEYLLGILIIVLLVRRVMLEEQLARTVCERGWGEEQLSALTR